VHDVEFDETSGFQNEYENLDEAWGIQPGNSMKNIKISDVKPIEVIEVEDDKDKWFLHQVWKPMINLAKMGSNDQDQIQQVQGQHLASPTQVAQSSNQPSSSTQYLVQSVTIAIDHPLD
jgi:hypothetical protein